MCVCIRARKSVLLFHVRIKANSYCGDVDVEIELPNRIISFRDSGRFELTSVRMQ